MKQLAMLAISCLGLAAPAAHAEDQIGELVFIGTHGTTKAPQADDKGYPPGIYAARFDARSGHFSPLRLLVELERATWLVIHPKLPVVYSVADSGGGPSADSDIVSFAIDRRSGTLTKINEAGAGGIDATHLDIDAQSKTLFVASYGSGALTALPLRPDGSLGDVASGQKDYGTGPHPRQKKPVAHGVAVDPSHRYVLVADFGADRIFVYHFDGAKRTLSPADPPFEATPPGSAPRHLAFHPGGHFLYVDTELSAEVRAYSWDRRLGRLHLVQAVPLYPADYAGGAKSAAELTISADGRFLYASLRGDQDSIVAYAVNKRTGGLQEIQRISSGGKSPWSLGIDRTGRWMLVTNEASNSVAVFGISHSTGMLTATAESLAVPKPVTVAFYGK